MEAGAHTPSRLGGALQGEITPRPMRRLATELARPLDAVTLGTADLATFSWRSVIAVGGSWRYGSEVLRQVGILIVGSALVIWAMEFVVGLQCATEGDYALRGFGASAYTGVFTAYCSVREMGPYMFAYIAAAKVGCGLVAEVGSMRINEEIDALGVMGVDPMRYLVATRLIAVWLTFPIIYIIGLGFHFVGDYVVIALQLKDVSVGGWSSVHWAFQNPLDIVFSEIKVLLMGTAIVLVAMYYGYTARDGPVGVGRATANSMIVNMLLIHLIGSATTALFWGFNTNAPIGG